jgi:vitamin B12 transporter
VHEHVQVFGRVENLTGEEYAEVFGFPALDTGLYAGVKVSY